MKSLKTLSIALVIVLFTSVVGYSQIIRNDGVPRKEYQQMKKFERQETNKVVQKGIDARAKKKRQLMLENSYRNYQYSNVRYRSYYVPTIYYRYPTYGYRSNCHLNTSRNFIIITR